MSDRFYKQQCEYHGITGWEFNRALWFPESDEPKQLERKSMTKVTRKDLAKEFKEITSTDTDISKLPLKTAFEVVEFVKKGKKIIVNMPEEKRKKDPHLQILIGIFGKLDFSTATIAVMRGILEVIKK